MKIKLIDPEAIHSIIPLLNVLNPNISDEILSDRLIEMVSQGYQCVGVYDQEKLVGICGLWILTKYYVGKHIEPDNMVFLPEYHSKGLGQRLMQWIYNYGRNQGCIASELNCYCANTKGQAFWEKQGYQMIAYHYQKTLLPAESS